MSLLGFEIAQKNISWLPSGPENWAERTPETETIPKMLIIGCSDCSTNLWPRGRPSPGSDSDLDSYSDPGSDYDSWYPVGVELTAFWGDRFVSVSK